MLQHFVVLPTFLIVQLSSNCIDQIFTLWMCQVDIIYIVKRMIPCLIHFTVVVKDDTHWEYIHDRCVLVRSHLSQDLLLKWLVTNLLRRR